MINTLTKLPMTKKDLYGGALIILFTSGAVLGLFFLG